MYFFFFKFDFFEFDTYEKCVVQHFKHFKLFVDFCTKKIIFQPRIVGYSDWVLLFQFKFERKRHKKKRRFFRNRKKIRILLKKKGKRVYGPSLIF